MPDEWAVQCKAVTKHFGQRMVLDGVDFRVARHEHCALVGENGSGKSTLLKIIAGLTMFDAGTISVLDATLIPRRHTIARGIGLVLEGVSLLPQLTGLQNLELLAGLITDPVEAGAVHLRPLLHEVGLDPDDHRRVGQYSRGMRQRLNLAQALVPRPQLLLLDEPSNGLDPAGIAWLISWVGGLQDVTVIMASHREDEISAMCSSVWRIADGSVRAELQGSE